jgi:hypothetical protein
MAEERRIGGDLPSGQNSTPLWRFCLLLRRGSECALFLRADRPGRSLAGIAGMAWGSPG